ncbi:MAG: FG-GAP-like repeat-containing protein [Gammaproteobacteria bacterium]
MNIKKCIPIIALLILSYGSSLFAYSFIFKEDPPVKWASTNITFYVDIGEFSSSFQSALASWNNAAGFNLQTINTYQNPCSDDNRNGVGFSNTYCGASWGDSTLAITGLLSVNGSIVESDIVFNNASVQWDVFDGASSNGTTDFYRVAVHEIGHGLGLDHEDTAPSIMESFYNDNIRSIQNDDLQGIRTLYPELVTIIGGNLADKNDFNNDGKSDIFWRNTATNSNKIYLMNGSSATTDTSVNIFQNDSAWEVVGNSDFNNDGKSDLLWRNSTTGSNYISIMDGTSVSSGINLNLAAFSDSKWKIAGLGDFNGDGNDDIFWHHDDGENQISFFNGSSLSSTLFVNTLADPNWKVSGIADFNNDGRDDVLWRNSSNRRVWLYLMNSNVIENGSGAGEHIAFTSANWDIQGVGDFDADGMGDILWRHNTNGRVWMYLMNGITVSNGTVDAPGQHVDFTGLVWDIQAISDYNGDGKQDIFWRNNVTGQNHMYLLNGSSLIQPGGASVNTLSDLNWKVGSK